ncbi:hypothetical protein XA68_13137 [Ophiocordyceps unilateralis]|uniref:Uncharacterized protein n=1 Tax=Ophiocordyceps unilateralis TaxID=268505 RepID=A0A2A9PM33_OPHUN|nr:hypothetical protein XA68_13137 [Ophiocordyceps unilateralis]
MPAAARTLFASGRHLPLATARAFHVSNRRLFADAAPAPLPPRKPMGAFRGGLFGFLFGCVLSGGAVYSYAVQELKASSDLVTDDLYTLQASVNRLSNYVKVLEEKVQSKK